MVTQKTKLDELCDDILEGIDYDIFKEDLEERVLMDEIAMKIVNKLKIEVI
jgi:hypothetical protein